MLSLAPWKPPVLGGGWFPDGMGTAFGDFVSLDLSGSVPGYCLVASTMAPSDVPASHVVLSNGVHPGEVRPNASVRNHWSTKVGQVPEGTTLREWVSNALSAQSDATGAAFRRPAIPKFGRSALTVNLGPYSFDDPFRASLAIDGRRIGPAVELLRANYAAIRTGSGVNAARVWLGRQLERFRLADSQAATIQGAFSSDGGPLPHGTTITESFDKANGTTLGPDLTWTEHVADFTINTNALAFSQAAHGYCSANNDLGADHYSQSTVPGSTSFAGPTTRTSATAGTGSTPCCYATYFVSGTLLRLRKYTSGQTFAEVASATVAQPTGTFVLKLTADGSSLVAAVDGVDRISATDTTLATPQRCGNFIYGTTPRVNSWEAGDLAVPSSRHVGTASRRLRFFKRSEDENR